MLHAVAREYRQLLTPDEGREGVYRRYAGAYVVPRVYPRDGVYRRAVDVGGLLGVNLAEAVDGSARAVEHPAEHLARERQLHRPACGHGGGVGQRKPLGALKDLRHYTLAVDLDYPAPAAFAVCDVEFNDLLVACVLNAVEHHERAGYFIKSDIFFNHKSKPFLFCRK